MEIVSKERYRQMVSENTKDLVSREEYEEIVNTLKFIKLQNDKILSLLEGKTSKVAIPKEVATTDRNKKMYQKMLTLYKKREITHKQYRVLNYLLENNYVSDTELSMKTGVSYSSVSQWKKNHKRFNELYMHIKTSIKDESMSS